MSMYLAFLGTTVALLVTMVFALARAVVGPSVFDRVLAANAFGTMTVLLIAAAGFLTDRPVFLDLALVYALMNFIGVIGPADTASGLVNTIPGVALTFYVGFVTLDSLGQISAISDVGAVTTF